MVTPDENNRRAEAFRKMLAQAPDKGKSNFLITHKPNIVDALGKDWFDVKEGKASIFKPEGGNYRLVARVQMEDWPKPPSLRIEHNTSGLSTSSRNSISVPVSCRASQCTLPRPAV